MHRMQKLGIVPKENLPAEDCRELRDRTESGWLSAHA
jgi:hypothetical protein